MALSGPVLVVSDEANDVCEALTRGGNLPMREVVPASAVAAIAKTQALGDRAGRLFRRHR